MSGVTINLFSAIGFNIEEFYFANVVVFGLAAVPIVGTYITRTNPQLVGKVSPVIAKIFSPIVSIMLAVYLVSMIYRSEEDSSELQSIMRISYAVFCT